MNAAPEFTDPPRSIDLPENSAPGTTVATVTATDADGDTLAYSLDSVSDEVFDVDGSGIISVQRRATLDYETTSSYAVILTVDDGSEEITLRFTVVVINQDEPPLSPGAPEVRSATATSLNVNWTVPDETGRPSISSYDVRYRLADTETWIDSPFDGIETNTTLEGLTENDRYEVQIRAINAEGTSSWSAIGTGTVVDPSKNAPPNFASPPDSLAIAENSEGGSVVGIVAAGDPEGDTLSYRLDDESAGLFTIDDRGRITVNDDVDLDHESTPTVTMTVTVTDEINDVVHEILIEITDENEPPGTTSTPTVASLSDVSLRVSWTAEDEAGKPPILAYEIQVRTDGTSEWMDAQFEGEGTSVVVIGLTARTTYDVRVRASNDEGFSDWSASASGTTNKENRAPTFDSPPSSVSVAENIAGGSTIGTVSASDAESDRLTYTLDSSSDEVFDIDDNGVITLQSEASLDFEVKSSYSLTVTVTDGRADATHNLSVQVMDVNEAPGKPAAPILSTPATNPRSSLAASWQAPTNTGPPINDYDVQYSQSQQTTWVDAVFDGTTTSTVISALSSGTSYDVRVRATNAEGTGEWSDAATYVVLGLSEADTTPIAKAWLSRFGRTVTDEVNSAIADRRNAATATPNDVEIAGYSLAFAAIDSDYTGQLAESHDERSVQPDHFSGYVDGYRDAAVSPAPTRELISNTSFNLTSGASGSGRGVASLWGRGGVTRFDGREGGLTLSGTVKTGFLATDWVSTGQDDAGMGRWMLGVALGVADGIGDFHTADTNGNLQTRLTGLFPYATTWVNDRLSIWGTAGFGNGELTFMPDGFAPLTTDVGMTMGSFGLRREMANWRGSDGLSFALKGDARFTQTSTDAASNGGISLASVDAETWLARFGIEGSRSVTFGDGSTVTPLVEIALRLDGGDAETGYGADIGGGFSFANSSRNARVDIKGRGLVTHEAPDFKEWGVSASFIWDPQPSNDRGFSMSLTQSLGAMPTGGMDALWSDDTFDALRINGQHDPLMYDDRRFDIARVFEGEINYALPTFRDGVLGAPYIGFGVSEIGRDWRIGWRLNSGGQQRGDVTFNLDAVHREFRRHGVPIDIGIKLRGRVAL